MGERGSIKTNSVVYTIADSNALIKLHAIPQKTTVLLSHKTIVKQYSSYIMQHTHLPKRFTTVLVHLDPDQIGCVEVVPIPYQHDSVLVPGLGIQELCNLH